MFEYWQGFLSADTRSVIDRGEIVETARIQKRRRGTNNPPQEQLSLRLSANAAQSAREQGFLNCFRQFFGRAAAPVMEKQNPRLFVRHV